MPMRVSSRRAGFSTGCIATRRQPRPGWWRRSSKYAVVIPGRRQVGVPMATSPETITPVLAIKAPPVVMDSGLARKRAPRNDGSMELNIGDPSDHTHLGPGLQRRGQPYPDPLLQGAAIEEMGERHILRNKTGGVDENTIVRALAAFLCARYQLVDFGVERLARKLAHFDHALE